MHRKLVMIIGIIIFILVIGCTYTNQTNAKKSDNTLNKNLESTEIKQGEIIYKGKLPMPIENFIQVTSKFGYRNPVYNSQGVQISGGKLHSGIDLCGSLGSNIMAVKEGEIIHAGWQDGYGNCVEIKHIDEQGNSFYSFYAHMRDNSIRVQKGQSVITGQVIGTQGNTGNSTGEHLHFEIRTNSGSNQYAIDPAPYIFTEKEG